MSGGRWLAGPALVCALAALSLTAVSAASDHPIPSGKYVRAMRFIRTVSLDNGSLVISPAPAKRRPPQSAPTAWRIAYSAVIPSGGEYQPALPGGRQLLAYGLVSIRSSLESGLLPADRYRRRLAWVAMGSESMAVPCPEIPGGSGPGPKLSPGQERDPGYMAVIIGPAAVDTVSYRSRTSTCDGPYLGPLVSATAQLLSVPWARQPGSADAEYSMPPCGHWVSSESGSGDGASALGIQVAVPWTARGCPAAHQEVLTGAISGPGPVTHYPAGPVFATSPTGPPPPVPENLPSAPSALGIRAS